MANVKLSGTNLVVDNFVYQQTQHAMFREEQGETRTLLSVHDTVTGEKGHILHEIAFDKRDVDSDEAFTDNIKLFETNHPEMCDLPYAPDGTPDKTTEAIKEIIANCEHGLVYREGNPKGKTYVEKAWGLYLES